MQLSDYQHRLLRYVAAQLPGCGEAQAVAWLDCYCARWREDNPPQTNQITVAAPSQGEADEEQDDDQ